VATWSAEGIRGNDPREREGGEALKTLASEFSAPPLPRLIGRRVVDYAGGAEVVMLEHTDDCVLDHSSIIGDAHEPARATATWHCASWCPALKSPMVLHLGPFTTGPTFLPEPNQ
jgi:hypothetical protein